MAESLRADSTFRTSKAHTWTATQTFNDDILVRWGTGGDFVGVLRAATLVADEELTNVIVGTSVHPATPANTMLFSNITDDGDVVFFTATGGNSIEAFRIDASESGDVTAGGAGWALINESASATNPTLVPTKADVDTGIGHQTGDVLSLIAGGFEMVRLVESVSATAIISMRLDAPDLTLSNSASARYRAIGGIARTITLSGQTQVTLLNQGMGLDIVAITLNQSGGAVTVDETSTLHVPVVTAGTSVTITNNRMISTGVSDCYLTVGGVWTDTVSTTKVKRDIEDLDWTKWDMHELIGQLHPITWKYNGHFNNDFDRQRFGIAAEDFPDFLKVPGEANPRGVSGSIMANFALAGLVYLEQENADLRERVAALEAE